MRGVLLVVVAGCGRLEFDATSDANRIDAPAPCLVDDFSGPSLDSKKWGSFETAPTTFSITAGELVIQLATTTQVAYAGLATPRGDIAGSSVEVELVEAPASVIGTEVTLGWVLDSANQCVMYVGNAGRLTFRQTKLGAITDVADISFDPVQHRHWAMQHEPSTNLVRFSTSADGTTWTLQHESTLGFPSTGVFMEILAGTYQSVTSPGRARLDNVVVRGCTP